jgi:ribosomal protein L37AE/L43A
MSTQTCPCCSQTLLRHISAKGIYWFCPNCYQEMPTLVTEVLARRNRELVPLKA